MLALFTLLFVLGSSAGGEAIAILSDDDGVEVVDDQDRQQEKAESLAVPATTLQYVATRASKPSDRRALDDLQPYEPNLNERDGYTETFAASIETTRFEPAPRKKRYPPGAPLNL